MTVRPATSATSQRMKTWAKSRQKDPSEAEMHTRAAPMTPSLNRLSIKPPVMMPKATAGRFRIPERIKNKFRKRKVISIPRIQSHTPSVFNQTSLRLCIEKSSKSKWIALLKKVKKYGSCNLFRSGYTCWANKWRLSVEMSEEINR